LDLGTGFVHVSPFSAAQSVLEIGTHPNSFNVVAVYVYLNLGTI
jgi:hypothetical protein